MAWAAWAAAAALLPMVTFAAGCASAPPTAPIDETTAADETARLGEGADSAARAAADADAAATAEAAGTEVANADATAAAATAAAVSAATGTAAWSRVSATRLTEPGCCPLPFWSADGRTVLMWDEIGDSGGAGIYGVPVTGGAAQFVSDLPVSLHLGGRFTTAGDGDATVVTRQSDGASWRLETQGASVALAVDGSRAAWVEGLDGWVPGNALPPLTHRVAEMRTDAVTVTRVAAPVGYAISDWTATGGWLMSLMDRRSDEPTLIRFDPDSGEVTELLDGERLRTLRASPGRTWVALTRTYEAEANDNGVYIISADGAAPPRRLELAGGYRWRSDDELLLVPQTSEGGPMELWLIDAPSGAARKLPVALPDGMPFRIAAGEWSVAPNGEHLAFRSAIDDAVWALQLPPVGEP
ncbi:MAG: hypothetical protein ACK2UL_09790 [Anaerolineae bacterium]